MNLDDDNFKNYIDSLKSEIKKRDNKAELNKKIVFTDSGAFFINSHMSLEEHEKLVGEIGQEGIWFYPICTKEEIHRIQNPQNCKDLLLQKQASYIADHARTRRVFFKRKELFDQNKQDWSLSKFYDQFNHFDQYLKVLKPNIKRRCKSVDVGFVFMTEPNGICERTEFGNIIYLSESLTYFLHFMNFVMLTFLSFEFDQEQRYESLYIGLRVMLGAESLDFDLDPRYDTLPNEIVTANNNLVEKQLMFIIGHEYAHHVLGHLNNTNLLTLSSHELFMTNNETHKIYNYSQKKELDADWHSLKNTKLTKKEKEEMLNGAFLFFIYIDIFRHVQEYLFPQGSIYKTHPDPLDRLWKLRKKTSNPIGFNRSELNAFIDHADNLKKGLAEELLPYRPELFEFTGSVYLSKYKNKKLVDRIDF